MKNIPKNMSNMYSQNYKPGQKPVKISFFWGTILIGFCSFSVVCLMFFLTPDMKDYCSHASSYEMGKIDYQLYCK